MKILILRKIHPEFIKQSLALGHEVNYQAELPKSKVSKIIHEYDILIVGRLDLTIDEALLKKAKNLKIIGRPGSGLDMIDLSYCKIRDIQVINSPEANSNAVGEHAMAMLLMLLNKLRSADLEVKNLIWEREKNRGFELKGQKVGIIGFGHTGKQFAKKLSGFEVEVLAYDKYKTNYCSDLSHVKEVKLEEVWKEADIISFHLQHNEETHHYLNADFIEACQKDFILINTSRGKIVDTKALYRGLIDGKIKGACLDVLENEKPLTYNSLELELYKNLFKLKQVIVSPHVAGWSQRSKIAMSMVLFDKIMKALDY